MRNKQPKIEPGIAYPVYYANTHLLKEGDIIKLEKGDIVYGFLPKSLVYSNTPGNLELCHTEITIGQYGIPSGEYIVYKTATDGGGSGHGPHDSYPDGHHIWCFHKDFPHIVLDFYQNWR